MNNRTYRMKRIIFSLLNPKAIIVGIAVFNFMVLYLSAKEIEGLLFCFGSPWYITLPFSDFPALLLIAAIGLFLGRSWSYLVTISLSLAVIYWGIVKSLFLVGVGALAKWMIAEPGLLFQCSLAVTLLAWSLMGLIRIFREKLFRSARAA